jgi:O-antigen/teichoic acid export membrane protein
MATIALRVQDPSSGILRFHDRFTWIAAIQIGQAFAMIVVAWILWYQEASLPAYLIATAIVPICAAGALFVLASRIVRPVRPTRAVLREVLFFSIPVGLSGTIGAFRQRGLVLLLGLLSGPAAVGIYSVADRIASVMGMAHATFFQASFREVQTYRPLSRFVLFTGLAGLFLSIAALAVVVLFGKWMLEIAAGAEFLPAYWPLVLLVAAYAMPMAGVGIRAAIIVHVGPKLMLLCNVIAILSFSAAPLLLVREGAVGAAIVSLLFEGIWFAVAVFIFVRGILVPATSGGN